MANIGSRFGRLVVIDVLGVIDGRSRLLVQCDCGTRKAVRVTNLRNGSTLSCGCLIREVTSRRRKTHGMTNTRAYITWRSMCARCYDPGNPSFKHYGGRGIAVCDRWRTSFEAFYRDTGDPPAGMSLDRIDNDRGYEPGNCRWSNAQTQGQNRRSVKLTADSVSEIRGRREHGESIDSLAARFGVDRSNIEMIIHRRTWRNVP